MQSSVSFTLHSRLLKRERLQDKIHRGYGKTGAYQCQSISVLARARSAEKQKDMMRREETNENRMVDGEGVDDWFRIS
jgi:hypothetical protein